eukprot:830948-Prymnesium_polylepis.1
MGAVGPAVHTTRDLSPHRNQRSAWTARILSATLGGGDRGTSGAGQRRRLGRVRRNTALAVGRAHAGGGRHPPRLAA